MKSFEIRLTANNYVYEEITKLAVTVTLQKKHDNEMS